MFVLRKMIKLVHSVSLVLILGVTFEGTETCCENKKVIKNVFIHGSFELLSLLNSDLNNLTSSVPGHLQELLLRLTSAGTAFGSNVGAVSARPGALTPP